MSTPDLSQEHAPDSQGEPPPRRDDAARERPHHNAQADAEPQAAGTGRERDEPSLLALLASIRERLDALNVAPLSDDDLAHLVAIKEWLTDLGGADV